MEIHISLLEEFLKRFFSPIFIILIGLSSSLIIMTGKNEKLYRTKNILYFCLGIFFLIISEISLKYSGTNNYNTVFYFLIPFILFFTIYLYIYIINRNHRRDEIAN